MESQISKAIEKARQTLKTHDSLLANGEWYGIQNLFNETDWRKEEVAGRVYEVFADDPCGNHFVTDESRRVLFWDHETDDLISVSDSVITFLSSLIPAPEVHLKPGQVISVWVDPSFKPKFD